jgi:hypothetical protein
MVPRPKKGVGPVAPIVYDTDTAPARYASGPHCAAQASHTDRDRGPDKRDADGCRRLVDRHVRAAAARRTSAHNKTVMSVVANR